MVKNLVKIYQEENENPVLNYKPVKNLQEILNKKSEKILNLEEQICLAKERQNLSSCPICLEYFSPWSAKWVVTSCCSGVFHKKCLNSILNLNNQKIDKFNPICKSNCPLCRSPFSFLEILPSLQTSFYLITNAVIKIQSHFKGHLVRLNSKIKINRKIRLQSMTKRLNDEKKSLFNSIDDNLKIQKQLLEKFELSFIDWVSVRKNCMEKNLHLECAICMEANFRVLNKQNNQTTLIDEKTKNLIKFDKNYNATNTETSIVLLNCEHCFHKRCLNSWVKFKNNCEICPLCRSNFFKNNFIFL